MVQKRGSYMTQEAINDQMGDSGQRRSRGPTKAYPTITFEEAVFLPRSILENGVDGEIQRLTLLRELGYSPSSSKTRNLIGGSHKYGLTDGSYNAQSLVVTDAGRMVLRHNQSPYEAKEKEFELAISQFSPFKTLYDKFKGNRLREGAVLQDELQRAGISQSDRQQAADIFSANLRFLGLVYDVAGNDYVRSIEEALEEIPKSANDSPEETDIPTVKPVAEAVASVEGNGKAAITTNRPALHIDIQVHIDPTSSADQIDQIFASMAKHFYGNES